MDHFSFPTESVKTEIYRIYLAVFAFQAKTQKKCLIMTPVLGGFESSWRVVGITKAALDLLEKSDYKYQKGTICRAHIVARYETAKILFERTSPLEIDDFFLLVWSNDRTVISTKSENRTNGRLPHIIPIDISQKLFICNEVVGFKYRKAERDYLKKLYSSYQSGEINTVCPYS